MINSVFYIPLSWLYALGVAIRHFLYDKHLFLSHSVTVPTICVGNLAVGGTGKTPMVEYLLRLLLANGYHPAVLSRGYKRKTHGCSCIVSPPRCPWRSASTAYGASNSSNGS